MQQVEIVSTQLDERWRCNGVVNTKAVGLDMVDLINKQYTSVLYSPKNEELLAFKENCEPVYISKTFSKMIHLQGIPLAPKTRETIKGLQGRTVVYPPSESINSIQEKSLFKKAVEEWFHYRLEAEGYTYVIK